VSSGQITETGVWVAGFYGSGKSSFTKYLGFSLDGARLVGGRPFLDLLCERLRSMEIKASLRTLATQSPAAVVFLDLGSEELADTSAAPVSTVLYWKDIREITYRCLLTKSPDGERKLKEEFGRHGQALLNFTRLTGTTLYRGDPDAESFARLYPFLPQHFDLLLELIRTLARSTGGIGLRSAIRVIQDLLVDTSRVLPATAVRIADRPVGILACADDFYVVCAPILQRCSLMSPRAVERVALAFPGQPLAIRVAKTIGVLQAVENFPKTAERHVFQTVPDGEHVTSARCSAPSSTRGTNIPFCMTPSSATLATVCP
jgi:hypothetical protein